MNPSERGADEVMAFVGDEGSDGGGGGGRKGNVLFEDEVVEA